MHGPNGKYCLSEEEIRTIKEINCSLRCSFTAWRSAVIKNLCRSIAPVLEKGHVDANEYHDFTDPDIEELTLKMITVVKAHRGGGDNNKPVAKFAKLPLRQQLRTNRDESLDTLNWIKKQMRSLNGGESAPMAEHYESPAELQDALQKKLKDCLEENF